MESKRQVSPGTLPKEPHVHDTKGTWNDSQGFFAAMGGFSVCVRSNEQQGTVDDQEYLLTADGVELLALADCLPKITPEEIEERSNADVIAKIIVVCQVTWFALQVLTRLIEGLPVTALEAHTTVHVGCAIAMYMLWFSKPYNIDRSILLTDSGAQEIAALLIFRRIWNRTFRSKLEGFDVENERYWRERVVRAAESVEHDDPPPSPPLRESIDKAVAACVLSIKEGTPTTSPDEQALQSLAPDAEAGLRRLQICLSSPSFLRLLNRTDRPGVRKSANNYELRSVWGSWTRDIGHSWSREKLLNVLFNTLYGAGHLAAWEASSFPTTIERWIWRGSGLMLVAVPVWGLLWILWWKASTSKSKWFFIFRNGDLDILGGPFFCLVIVAYTVARCYFLIEALISLRALPSQAYKQVDWTKVLPNVS